VVRQPRPGRPLPEGAARRVAAPLRTRCTRIRQPRNTLRGRGTGVHVTPLDLTSLRSTAASSQQQQQLHPHLHPSGKAEPYSPAARGSRTLNEVSARRPPCRPTPTGTIPCSEAEHDSPVRIGSNPRDAAARCSPTSSIPGNPPAGSAPSCEAAPPPLSQEYLNSRKARLWRGLRSLSAEKAAVVNSYRAPRHAFDSQQCLQAALQLVKALMKLMT